MSAPLPSIRASVVEVSYTQDRVLRLLVDEGDGTEWIRDYAAPEWTLGAIAQTFVRDFGPWADLRPAVRLSLPAYRAELARWVAHLSAAIRPVLFA